MNVETHGQGEDLVVIFRAPDEFTANMVCGLLVGEAIPARIQSRMVPWMDGVFKVDVGYWGDVLVPEEDALRSRELIEAYQSQTEPTDGSEVDTPDDHR